MDKYNKKYIKNVEIEYFTVLFNLNNGKYIAIENNKKDDAGYINKRLDAINFYSPKEEFKLAKENIPVITITLNLSAKCNLKCTYCFRNDNDISQKEISFEDSVKFIDLIMSNYPYSKHFHIDLTGDGEPLLRFDLIKKIIQYTKSISQEGRTIKVGLCTNGTLLSKEITRFFEDNDIYYGISIDGPKKLNDHFRKDYSNRSVYKTIMRNMRNGKSKYRGAAITITNKSSNFVRLFKKLSNHFDVLTLKPIREESIERGALDQSNIIRIMDEYTNLYNFLLVETLKLNTWCIVSIIRDEDLLGKFIRRIILNQTAMVRCGGGINKFTLSKTNDIYICGAATQIQELNIGSLENGLNESQMKQLFNIQMERAKCSNCWAQYICGGPCLVHAKNKYNDFAEPDETICELNKHLIKLAFLFRETLIRKHRNIFNRVYEICMDNHYR
ncbi:MAG: radical SAM protein [Bacillota bacterium]